MSVSISIRTPSQGAGSVRARNAGRLTVLSGLLLMAVACSSPAQQQGANQHAGVASQQQGDARSQFDRFLSTAIASRVQKIGMYESLYTCTDREMADNVKWLADYKVLAVDTAAGNAVVTARVTVVANQVLDHDFWSVRPTIEEFDAHWRMERDAETAGRWMVCGDAVEQFGVFLIGRDVRWPPGTSAKAVIATIDSLRQARGLPIAR